ATKPPPAPAPVEPKPAPVEPKPAPVEPTPAPAPAPPPPPAQAHIVITSKPPGALVVDEDGTSLGPTPHEVVLDKGAKHEYRLRKDGYYDESVPVVAEHDEELRIAMRALPRPTRDKPDKPERPNRRIGDGTADPFGK